MPNESLFIKFEKFRYGHDIPTTLLLRVDHIESLEDDPNSNGGRTIIIANNQHHIVNGNLIYIANFMYNQVNEYNNLDKGNQSATR